MVEQLHMVLCRELWDRVRPIPLAPEYELRTWRPEDGQGWSELMHAAGFDGWGAESMRVALDSALPGGVFFAVHPKSGRITATAMAGHNGTVLHPFGGEIGWVAGHPAHRGRKLGAHVTVAATRRFLTAGYEEIYLRTDDFRLPAIKVYLDLGYVPLLHLPEMEARWRAVAAGLGMDFLRMRPVTRAAPVAPAGSVLPA